VNWRLKKLQFFAESHDLNICNLLQSAIENGPFCCLGGGIVFAVVVRYGGVPLTQPKPMVGYT
jgi:hypothetical protein